MIERGYDFDDVLIKPIPGGLNSRDSVDLSCNFGTSFSIRCPIIASPMKGIVGPRLIASLADCGGIGILHRFYDDDDSRMYDIDNLDKLGIPYGVAVKLGEDKFILNLLNYDFPCIICIDVANGYQDQVALYTERVSGYVRDHYYTDTRPLVMAGNVATHEGALRLYNAGADIIRVGIGSGNLCTTRNKTGIGVPQISAIMDCCDPRWHTVADGGIRNSGDAMKALAAGANSVMIGSLFGAVIESDHDGHISGMASKEFQEEFYGEVKTSIEGITKQASKDVTMAEFMDNFIGGMKSSMTYTNSNNLHDLHNNVRNFNLLIEAGRGSIKEGY